jgi:hypothetical protein
MKPKAIIAVYFKGSEMETQLKKNLTKRQKIIAYVILGLFMIGALYFGYYYEATGRYPVSFLNKPAYILPPKMDSQCQTYEQVINFVRSDDTDETQYGIGFNCVDATFRMWRNATWKGIRVYPIVIQYDEPPGHMIIVFPTKDRGDIFIEPQNDWQVRPQVGQNYNDRKIRGFYVLDYAPIPLDNSPQYDLNIKPE